MEQTVRAALVEAIRAAAEPLHAPGASWRILSPARQQALAAAHGLPGWQVEIVALEAEVVPLLYLRNVGRYAIPGQILLLRSAVTVVGFGPPAQKCLENLAALGVGRLRALVPLLPALGVAKTTPIEAGRPRGARPVVAALDSTGDPWREAIATALAAAVQRQNGSLEVSADVVDLRRGDPTGAMGQPDVLVACVEDVAEEMLLQAVARRLEIPLVIGGVQDEAAQVTTVLPGDPGVGLVYQDDHPHLDRNRPGSLARDGLRPKVVGSWLADQVIAVLLSDGDLLQNRLLYADMAHGGLRVYPLRQRSAG